MDKQHEKIKGYRNLSQEEIDSINKGKCLAEQVSVYLTELENLEDSDKRCISLARTNLQQGFMWAIRGIARPESF